MAVLSSSIFIRKRLAHSLATCLSTIGNAGPKCKLFFQGGVEDMEIETEICKSTAADYLRPINQCRFNSWSLLYIAAYMPTTH